MDMLVLNRAGWQEAVEQGAYSAASTAPFSIKLSEVNNQFVVRE
jgi:hypothetical protein